MLTVLTTLKVFRFRFTDLEKKMDLLPPARLILFMSYSWATEIEAMLRDEPCSPMLIDVGMGKVKNSKTEEGLTFVCSDGTYECPYSKYTLARHSNLVRDFISDFPNESSIDMSRHSKSAVSNVIKRILGVRDAELNQELIYALQMLSPPTDLYYLLFDLPTSLDSSFIISIINGMTQEERDEVLHCYNSSVRHGRKLEDTRELPDRGRGLAIAFAFPSIYNYAVDKRIPELYDLYPSYIFYLLIQHRVDKKEARDMLLSTDFCDDSGLLPNNEYYQHIVDTILEFSTMSNWRDFCTIMGMLGMKDTILENEDVVRLAPYQVTLKKGSISYSIYERIRNELMKMDGFTPSQADAVRRVMLYS